MSDADRQSNPPLRPAIRWAPLDQVTIFHVTEAELETLQRGSTVSLFLNLAVAAFSAATSFAISLSTTKIDSDRTFIVFVVATIVGYLACVTFFLLWLFTRKSIKSVAREIRKRLPPEGTAASSSPTTGEEQV